jgi:hypothetical protein
VSEKDEEKEQKQIGRPTTKPPEVRVVKLLSEVYLDEVIVVNDVQDNRFKSDKYVMRLLDNDLVEIRKRGVGTKNGVTYFHVSRAKHIHSEEEMEKTKD